MGDLSSEGPWATFGNEVPNAVVYICINFICSLSNVQNYTMSL